MPPTSPESESSTFPDTPPVFSTRMGFERLDARMAELALRQQEHDLLERAVIAAWRAGGELPGGYGVSSPLDGERLIRHGRET